MHVAAALGTPTVALFGPTDPRLWGPLNPLAGVLEAPFPDACPQCGRIGCVTVQHRRIDAIAPKRAVEAIHAVLAAKGIDANYPKAFR
jgi:heptosyltransferase-2